MVRALDGREMEVRGQRVKGLCADYLIVGSDSKGTPAPVRWDESRARPAVTVAGEEGTGRGAKVGEPGEGVLLELAYGMKRSRALTKDHLKGLARQTAREGSGLR